MRWVSRIDPARHRAGLPLFQRARRDSGGESLLRICGWPRVRLVLAAIDAVEVLGLDPAEAAPASTTACSAARRRDPMLGAPSGLAAPSGLRHMTWRATILTLGAAGLVLGLAPAALSWPPALVWNAPASAPIGLYLLQIIDRPQVGDLVAIQPPSALAAWLDRRGAVPLGVLLVKRVAAVAPSTACWTPDELQLDGKPVVPLR